jgi:predicted aldo/keto reductase-like oxidoreductase
VGRALGDGYRDKVRLATKLPPWLTNKREDFDRVLKEQLDRLQTDRIDFYLLHGLNSGSWAKLRDLGVITWAEGALADGRIGHLGFSFHDDLDAFKEIIDAYDRWTFCQIQYNFMDVEFQAGTEGLKYAAEKGLGVVVMEPIRGGHLTKKLPDSIDELWKSAPKHRAPADWALQFVWNHPEVSTVLSGMTAMQHVEENVASADRSAAGSLSPEEIELISKVREEYQRLSPIPCTNCGYCMPCPSDVQINRILGLYNDGFIYDDHRTSRGRYRMLSTDQQADNCTECGECEEKCPQEIPIAEWLEKAHGWLGPKQ